nr:immunoglobulin light chain junction region [Macaca mulatta]
DYYCCSYTTRSDVFF